MFIISYNHYLNFRFRFSPDIPSLPSIDKLNKHRNKYNKSSGTLSSLCSQTNTCTMHSSLVCDMQMLFHRILELAQIWTGCGVFLLPPIGANSFGGLVKVNWCLVKAPGALGCHLWVLAMPCTY